MARPGAKARGGAASEIGERSMRLDGKTAMITGGVSGIGKATVLEFARSGAKVICADINMEKGAELVKEAAAQKLPVEYVKIDMADRGAVRACAAQVLERHGHVDILVNAAGMNDFQLFIENKPEYIDRVLAVNLGGALHLTHALLPAMIAAGGGKIVSVASDAGRVGSTGETVYAAAKAGLIGFTKSLAREMARYKINVNCVCPGPTDTPRVDFDRLRTQHFLWQRDGKVATVTLNRPERKNPLTLESYAELRDLFRDLVYAEDIKAVVIAGAGGNFCSGGDVHEIIGPLVEMQRAGDMAGLLKFTRMTGDLLKAMRACPQPIVAAIDGVCAGAGAILDAYLGNGKARHSLAV